MRVSAGFEMAYLVTTNARRECAKFLVNLTATELNPFRIRLLEENNIGEGRGCSTTLSQVLSGKRAFYQKGCERLLT